MMRGLLAGLLFILCLKLLSFSLVESSATLKIKEQPALQKGKQQQHSTNTTIELSPRGNKKREVRAEEEENSKKRVSLKAKGTYGGGNELRHSRPAKNRALPSSPSSVALSFSVFLLLFFLFEA